MADRLIAGMLGASTAASTSLGSPAREEPRFARALLLVPALLLLLIAFPYRYQSTLAEPDLVRMMAGLVYGGVTGLGGLAGMHYGMDFSFGYYRLLYAIAPSQWLRDPDAAAALINGAGVAAGVLCAGACALYLEKLFGLAAAAGAAALFFLSPVMLPAAFSGHPLVGAAACLFAAGWLIVAAEEGERTRGSLACYAGAFLLLLAGLSVRAEIVLAFPFVWLATPRPLVWRDYLARALVLAAAFGVFLLLQQPYVTANGGTAGRLSSFIETFMSLSRVGRGVVVLTLASGIATLAAVLVALIKERSQVRRFWLPIVLAAPALLLWLPNPQPARHFFFVVLGACLVVALWLAGRKRAPAQVLLLCLAVAAANALLAELVRPAIVSTYPWNYSAVVERRATQQVPLGAFPLDQRANQAREETERQEAIRLARQVPSRLLILADSQHYLIAHLLAADPRLRWSESRRGDLVVTRLESPQRSIALVEKYGGWPRDVTGEVLQMEDWKEWPVYEQPSTVSRFDQTRVPAARRFALR